MNEFRLSAVMAGDVDYENWTIPARVETNGYPLYGDFSFDPMTSFPPDGDLQEGAAVSIFGRIEICDSVPYPLAVEVTRDDAEGGDE
jgi:hypothetical protein